MAMGSDMTPVHFLIFNGYLYRFSFLTSSETSSRSLILLSLSLTWAVCSLTSVLPQPSASWSQTATCPASCFFTFVIACQHPSILLSDLNLSHISPLCPQIFILCQVYCPYLTLSFYHSLSLSLYHSTSSNVTCFSPQF